MENELRKCRQVSADILSKEEKFGAIARKTEAEIQAKRQLVAKTEKEILKQTDELARLRDVHCQDLAKMKRHKDYRSEDQAQKLSDTIQEINDFVAALRVEAGLLPTPTGSPNGDSILYKPN